MKNIEITCTKKTAIATYLPYTAYKRAEALATAHKGKIGKTAEGLFTATFTSAKVAQKFVDEWTAEYNANKKPAPTPTQKPKASKPTATKGKKAPRKAKGEAFDFSKIKGDTKKDKNRALHAMLVGMGIADSRTPEYQAVWNARPWAK